MRTCGECIHKAPGKFTGQNTIGVPELAQFHGCEHHAAFVGVQDSTKACKWFEPAECPVTALPEPCREAT